MAKKYRIYANIPLPQVTSFPDMPEDGIWDVTKRLVNIIKKKYRMAQKEMTPKEYKKEIERQNDADLISTSDNNLVRNASAKKKGEAFGIFLDELLDSQELQDKFKDTMDIVKEEKPDKWAELVLKIQKDRHPVDKSLDVNIEIQQKQTIVTRLKEQYRYSQIAQFEDDKQYAEIVEPIEDVSDHPSSTFQKQLEKNSEHTTTPTTADDAIMLAMELTSLAKLRERAEGVEQGTYVNLVRDMVMNDDKQGILSFREDTQEILKNR